MLVVGIVSEFNIKLHRWRENSFFLNVGGVLYVAFVFEAFLGWNDASNGLDS